MLVLSRKQNQAIRFPNLGIAIHVCRINGKTVRLGVDAPSSVAVLRDELSPETLAQESLSERQLGHQRRNQLNAARLALTLAQKQLEFGQVEEADATLAKAVTELERLDHELIGSSTSSPNHAVDGTSSDASPIAKQCALIVEDKDNERELLAGYFRLSGFRVDTAANGLEAIKYLSESADNPSQAVVLDMKMPKLDGAKMVSTIRFHSETKDLKLFAVSGTTPAGMNVPVGPRGVDGWFSKPVDPQSLVKQISADRDEMQPGYVWPLGVVFMPETSLKSAIA